jgi:predicted PurR-regulated permease PerM
MLSMVLAVGILIAIVAPPLVDQGANLVNTAPDYADDLSSILERYPTVNEWVDEATAEGGDANSLFERAMSFVPNLLSFGAGILSGAVSLFFLTVLTIYLLMDGPRLFESYTSRLDPEQRARFRKLRLELTRVVSGYVFGQALVSTSFGIFTFIALTIAGTPEPLLLAVLAAMLGTIPMVGATIATIPAVAMSLTVSLPTALVVLVAFVLYQQIENNFIAPRAFRNTLKISSLVVLIAVAFGSALYGVLGAMLALPIAAALPALVRGFREGVPLPPPAEELSWPSEPE